MSPKKKSDTSEEAHAPEVEETQEEEVAPLSAEPPPSEPAKEVKEEKVAAPAPEPAAAPVGPPGLTPGRIIVRGNIKYRVLAILGPNTVRAVVPNSGKIVVLDL